jgi:hypothetical protein
MGEVPLYINDFSIRPRRARHDFVLTGKAWREGERERGRGRERERERAREDERQRQRAILALGALSPKAGSPRTRS